MVFLYLGELINRRKSDFLQSDSDRTRENGFKLKGEI